MKEDNLLRLYREQVHLDVEACTSADTLDLVHKLMAREAEGVQPQRAAGVTVWSPWTAGARAAAK